jgi:rhamnosyltransferase
MTPDPAARVVAVVTAFRPGAELLGNLDAIRAQVARVVVVDDSGGGAPNALDGVADPAIEIVRLPSNEGIAHALNVGIRLALGDGVDAVVTFDQDSAPAPGFVDALVAEWGRARAAGRRTGLVVPAGFGGAPMVQAGREDRGFLVPRHPIQSGALWARELLEDCGPFWDELFIDAVDTEYFARLRVRGWDAVAVAGVDLPHRLGTQQPLTVLGRAVRFRGRALEFSVSTPFRYYYRARNALVVFRRYRGRFRRERWVDLLMEARHYLVVVTQARPRRAMIRVLAHGVRDARRGTLGRMPADLGPVAASIRWTGRDRQRPSG